MQGKFILPGHKDKLLWIQQRYIICANTNRKNYSRHSFTITMKQAIANKRQSVHSLSFKQTCCSCALKNTMYLEPKQTDAIKVIFNYSN